LVNRGLSAAKFVNLEVLPGEDYTVVSPSKIYIGNMESDDYESSNFKIYLEKGTEKVNLPLRLSYKDSEGNSMVEEETVPLNTYTNAEISKFNLKQGDGTIYYIVIGIVIIVGSYWLYRRRKSNQANILEEE
jgi:LPXTG-motif cell wall-anchored protein